VTAQEAVELVTEFAKLEDALRKVIDRIPQGRHCSLAKTKLDECRLWFADALAEVVP